MTNTIFIIHKTLQQKENISKIASEVEGERVHETPIILNISLKSKYVFPKSMLNFI